MRIIVRQREQDSPTKHIDSEWILTAIPPEEGSIHYGTGCYLSAIPIREDGMPDEEAKVLWDVGYARTTNLQRMAEAWIRDYYGGTITKKYVEYSVEQ